jgi:hypothetical protein
MTHQKTLSITLLFAGTMALSAWAAVTYPAPPAELPAKVSESLKGWPSGDAAFGTVEGVMPGRTFRIYGIPYEELMAGRFLSKARPYAWQTLLLRNDIAFASLSLELESLRFLSLGASEINRHLQDAMDFAERLPQAAMRDYEVRVLTYPTLLFALWLHSDSDDIVIPLPPTFENFKEFHPYPADEIAPILRRLAKEQAEAWKALDDTPRRNTSSQAEFERLHDAWRKECEGIRHSSRTSDYTSLPAFRKIVAMGKPALPLLEQKMATDSGLDFMLAFAVVEICGWDRKEFQGGGEQAFRDRVLARLREQKSAR